MKVILIDNYDSFTYNIYQQLKLCQIQDLTVYRNDQISLQQLIQLNPDKIILSPGPGHPKDALLCMEILKYFSGRIPILGVCLGHQAILLHYNSTIEQLSEPKHGKTSLMQHDQQGLFFGLEQEVEMTRYHSLVGGKIGPSLEITAWCFDNEQKVVMGVRHKEFTVCGVQFHPESICSKEGRKLFQNFISVNGGKWEQNPHLFLKQRNILKEIYGKKSASVQRLKQLPGQSFNDLKYYYEQGLAPPVKNFYQVLKDTEFTIIAEIKRASPSQGPIAPTINAVEVAKSYIEAGIKAISVLTEEDYFKGTPQDLNLIRQYLSRQFSEDKRPVLLRKDFISDQYQILESRLLGADTILLIVSLFHTSEGQYNTSLLKELLDYARSLQMEPLVEVYNKAEMEIALDLGALLIGINTRNLSTFQVDSGNINTLAPMIKNNDVILVGLSGIQERQQVEQYQQAGCHAVLIGTSIMLSDDKTKILHQLLGSE